MATQDVNVVNQAVTVKIGSDPTVFSGGTAAAWELQKSSFVTQIQTLTSSKGHIDFNGILRISFSTVESSGTCNCSVIFTGDMHIFANATAVTVHGNGILNKGLCTLEPGNNTIGSLILPKEALSINSINIASDRDAWFWGTGVVKKIYA